MGEEILVGSVREWLLFTILYGVVGIAFAFVLLFLFDVINNRKATITIATLYVIGWFLMTGPVWSVRVNANRHNEAVYTSAAQVQKEYSSTKLYLKESVVEPGTWGEVKGSFGGFLFITGNIYGKIDSGRVLTIVYKNPEGMRFINEQYAGKHLAFSKPLVDIVLETIPAGEKPYLMFPEAFTAKDAYDRIKVYPWKPHLYLPEGWVIL